MAAAAVKASHKGGKFPNSLLGANWANEALGNSRGIPGHCDAAADTDGSFFCLMLLFGPGQTNKGLFCVAICPGCPEEKAAAAAPAAAAPARSLVTVVSN